MIDYQKKYLKYKKKYLRMTGKKIVYGGANDCVCDEDVDEDNGKIACKEEHFDNCEEFVSWQDRNCSVFLPPDYCNEDDEEEQEEDYEENKNKLYHRFRNHISNYEHFIELLRTLNKKNEYIIENYKIPHTNEKIKIEVEEKLKEAETQAGKLTRMAKEELEKLSEDEMKYMEIWGIKYFDEVHDVPEIWTASILHKLIGDATIKLFFQKDKIKEKQWEEEKRPVILNKICDIEAAEGADIGSIPTSIDNCKNCDGTVPLTQEDITTFQPEDLVYLPSKNCETRDSYIQLFNNNNKDPFNNMKLPELPADAAY
tara:strand:- start:452 stop:1390 length:939 start_codon:yes stop_codon:yes gene_type:complete